MPPSPPDSGSVDVDALIVGAGPVGLYAACCAGFRGLTVLFPGHSTDDEAARP